MLFVVEVPDQPDGNVQVYVKDDPGTVATEQVCEEFGHKLVLPEITPGEAGNAVIETFTVLGLLLPQLFTATTDTVPPDDPVVVTMLLVVEVPVHPDGNDHIYEVAPDTALTEQVCEVP